MRSTIATSIVALAVLAAAAPQPTGQRVGMAIPIAKRSNLVNPDKTVNFDALRSHVAAVEAKIHRGLANFEINTGNRHPSDVRGVEKRGASIPLADGYSTRWHGNISVGTPDKPFTVLFDTGSSDLILPESTCDSTCDGHTRWVPSSSSTSKDLGKPFVIGFGDGNTASGEQYTDNVCVAGFIATSQTLGAATHYSPGFEIPYFTPDGIVGMAFKSIAIFSASPVFQTLISQGQVSEPAFSFKLSSSGSELFIGGSNPDLYTGTFTHSPVIHQAFWEVIMDSVVGNGHTLLSNVNAIIDTGTALIVGPPSQVSDLSKSLGGKPAPSSVSVSSGTDLYVFPCESFPNITLAFGGKLFPISASALNIGQVSSDSPDCLSGIYGRDNGLNHTWIIGDVFLQSVYTKFDIGKLRVEFATLA